MHKHDDAQCMRCRCTSVFLPTTGLVHQKGDQPPIVIAIEPPSIRALARVDP